MYIYIELALLLYILFFQSGYSPLYNLGLSIRSLLCNDQLLSTRTPTRTINDIYFIILTGLGNNHYIR